MVHDTNPYAAPTIIDQAAADSVGLNVSPRRYWWAVTLAALCVLGSLPAAGLAVWEIETITASGPTLLVLSIILSFVSRPPDLRVLWSICGFSALVVIGIFLWINLTGMGPNDAQKPVGYTLVGIAVIMQLGWIPIMLVQRPSRASSTT